MTQEVAQRVAKSWLTRKVTFRAGAAGKGGSIELTRCYCADPVRVGKGELDDFLPSSLGDYAHVIVHVYLRPLKHWLLQIVSFSKAATLKFAVVLYDPLGAPENVEALRSKWKTYALPLLRAWYARNDKNNDLEKPVHGTNVPIVSAEVRLEECAPHENDPGNTKARTILPAVVSTEAGNAFIPSVTEIVVLWSKVRNGAQRRPKARNGCSPLDNFFPRRCINLCTFGQLFFRGSYPKVLEVEQVAQTEVALARAAGIRVLSFAMVQIKVQIVHLTLHNYRLFPYSHGNVLIVSLLKSIGCLGTKTIRKLPHEMKCSENQQIEIHRETGLTRER
ncbi:unnamed protein product [Phytophthora fragariaefolia]|uniref:Unnamed protein product n=1 Tax=Phytophthora fragariaefolia TaxID=1490495 RepID=A0A9W6X594_9STRA|nr:unnamed protein product [Phytophthora fragariaefolia]